MSKKLWAKILLPKKNNGSKRNGRSKRNRNRGSNPSRATGGERKAQPLTGSRNNPIISIRNLPLFGLRTRKRIPYFETIAITGSASAVFPYIYSANGVFDPNVTGTGHQPNGFDEMMKFFNHYTVMNARIRVMLSSRSAVPIHVALSVSGSTTVSSDYTVQIENGELIYATLMPLGIDGSVVTFKTSANAGAFQGLSNTIDDPDMRGDAASQPAEQLYFIITCWDPITAAAPLVTADVFIEYDTIFHEPRKAALD